MGAFKTHDFYYKSSDGTAYNYKLRININAEGIFTCTLPGEAAELLSSLGVELMINRQKNAGFYQHETMAGLLKLITNDFEEAFSQELVEDIVVLKYWINTRCTYGKRSDGEIIPNLAYEWSKGEKLKWQGGG